MSDIVSKSNSEESYEESISDDDVPDHHDNLDLEGKLLKKYNILHKLGKGTYSIVWLGYNIENQKYYAIKVQHPSSYKDGINETNFMKRLPEYQCFNNLLESFTIIEDNKKFLCSVYNLHSCNLDCLIRKDRYNDGLPFDLCLPIIKELITALYYLHVKLKVYHADFKTDNILIKGVTKLNKYLIEQYSQEDFNKVYTNKKIEYCTNRNKKLDNLSSSEKNKIRSKIHSDIYDRVIEKYINVDIDKYELENYNSIKVSLSDFGAFVDDGEYYDIQFGTRYYRAPENILIGKSSFPTDIWALGCTIFEMLTGEILFDPQKDKNFNRDFYHLKLINELCGEFPKEFLKKTSQYKKYFDGNCKLKFNKNLSYSNIIDVKLKNKAPQYLIDLIKQMLIIDPAKRINIIECYNKFNLI